jgi:retron-type reverse transcriptase
MNIYEYLETTKDEVSDIVNNIELYYLSFPIKKSSGKLRWIDAPQGRLKYIQYNLLYKIFYFQSAHPAAFGFVRGKSVKDGAKLHLGNKVVLTIDIKDFFPSINRIDVLPIVSTGIKVVNKIRRNKNLEYIAYGHDDINLLSYLLTYKQQLPQGSPASPVIANLRCISIDKLMDDILKQFVVKYNTKGVYTRYADDMTFSCENKMVPIHEMIEKIDEVLKANGFNINKKKTRIRRPNTRMLVTGVVINEKLGVPKWRWRNLRAKIHNYIKDQVILSKSQYLELRGLVEWIRQLHPNRGMQLLESLGKIPLKN